MTARPRFRLVVLVAFVAAGFAAAALFVPRSPTDLRAALGGGASAGVLVLAAWILLTPALVPGTLLAAATGLLLGPVLGFAVASCGATAGAVLAFLIARHTAGDAIASLGGVRLQRLRRRLASGGFMAVVAARFAPGVPATGLNYAAGLAGVRLRHFAPAVALGGAPRVLTYVMLGGAGGDPRSVIGLVSLALMAALAVPGLLLLRRFLRTPAQP